MSGKIIVVLTAVAVLAAGAQSPAAAASSLHTTEALRAADYLVDIQNSSGAIPDYPGAGTANWDSHMEYALWGLAAAYEKTHLQQYLDTMRAALAWLAARQRSDGSWWIGYTSVSPFSPLVGAYGISATIGLFIYDLWWYRQLSGDTKFANSLLSNVRTGLDFLYKRMRSPNGTFRSAYVRNSSGSYSLSGYRYASDQVDVYLGLRAAGVLLGRSVYTTDANALKTTVLGPTYFISDYKRYALGIRSDGSKDTYLSLLTVWPQGYIPWVMGSTYNTRLAVGWLDARRASDGAVIFRSGAYRYLLATEDMVAGHLGVATSGSAAAVAGSAWMLTLQDGVTGGLKTSPVNHDEASNLTSFAVLIWLGRRPPVPS